jgi:hypothetical protein
MMISESTLRSRIRRALARDGERLITPREGSSDALQYGPHYIVDDRNCMQAWCCDLEDLGREIGVLCETDVVMMQ